MLAEAGLSEDDVEYYSERLVCAMNDYTEHFGEGTDLKYSIRRRFGSIEIKLSIPGEKYDPFENGSDALRRQIEKQLTLNVCSQESSINYVYSSGVNTMTGIMGPVIFFSLLSSIISLDSVNDLTNMGFKILKRFVQIILFVILISIGISLLFFRNFGKGGFDFEPSQIITMLLNIIPINLISPFLENNTPQLVILAFLTGIALLLLGDRTKDLSKHIHQLNELIMKIMKIVLKLLPLIPFLSIATAIGRGNADVLLGGWKFVAASYIVYTICFRCEARQNIGQNQKSRFRIAEKNEAHPSDRFYHRIYRCSS